jgi:hypothetical protein
MRLIPSLLKLRLLLGEVGPGPVALEIRILLRVEVLLVASGLELLRVDAGGLRPSGRSG